MSNTTDGNDSGKPPKLHLAKDPVTTSKPPKTYQERVREAYRVDTVDKEIVRILMENPLATQKEMAALLGVKKGRVERSLKKPGVRKALDDIRADLIDLARRGQMIGLRKLMALATNSKDEWIQLNAAKFLAAPALSAQKAQGEAPGGFIYEVQVGPTGQIYQTVRPMADPALSPNKFPTPAEAMSKIIEAQTVKNKGD